MAVSNQLVGSKAFKKKTRNIKQWSLLKSAVMLIHSKCVTFWDFLCHHTVLAKRLVYMYHLLQDVTEIWLHSFNQNKDKGFIPNCSWTWLDNMLPQSTSVAHSTWVTVHGLLRTSIHRATKLRESSATSASIMPLERKNDKHIVKTLGADWYMTN